VVLLDGHILAALDAERNRFESLLDDTTDWEAFAGELDLVAGHQLHGDGREYFDVHFNRLERHSKWEENVSWFPHFALCSPRLMCGANEHNEMTGYYALRGKCYR